MKPYEPAFQVGERVRIASRRVLQAFARNWKYHHPLVPEQLTYAGQTATVERVGIYHGGDAIYQLKDVPGVWHEACLKGDAR